MKHRLMASIAAALMLSAGTAFAEYHYFQIEQLFSNASGTVQFIVMHESGGMDGENFWAGHKLTSTHAGVANTFTFNKNLPGGSPGYYGEMMPSPTANKRVLIATESFKALGIVTPDFVVKDGFLPTNGGTLNYADADIFVFPLLPTDGVTAINRNGAMIQNLATNFLGQSASVAAAGGPPAAIVPIAGVWLNPAESGSGFGLDYQNGALIVEAYSYLPAGGSQWYLAAGPVTNNVFTATLDKYMGGQCISCTYKDPGPPFDNDGTITITFTSPTTATVDLPGGRHFQIQRYFQSPPVAGAFIPVAGAWLNPSESGSGFGLDYENGTLIVEVYSYLPAGGSQWYLAAGPVTNNVFSATLDKYMGGQCISCTYKDPGPPFDNDGTITITFTSPTTATVDLPGGRHFQIQRYFQ